MWRVQKNPTHCIIEERGGSEKFRPTALLENVVDPKKFDPLQYWRTWWVQKNWTHCIIRERGRSKKIPTHCIIGERGGSEKIPTHCNIGKRGRSEKIRLTAERGKSKKFRLTALLKNVAGPKNSDSLHYWRMWQVQKIPTHCIIGECGGSKKIQSNYQTLASMCCRLFSL